MAERFNITAQLQLQAPRNVGQVVGQIRRQLQGVTANVKVKGDARAVAKVNKELRNVDKSARSSARSVGKLNRNLSEAARRFSVITVATGTMLAFAHAIKKGVGEAIAFERELVKISQVTGKSLKNLQGLTREITRLSTSLGASSSDLLNVSRILAQAGFSAQKTKQALDILAKTSLGATFDDIRNTTEGAIAILRQFRREAKAAGGDIKFLEQTMDAINAVSKRFAVESNDLISVIRRVGGVFESAGGSVNELIAMFTSVRATTRETAETIATGLRTIFTRMQRSETVDMLKQLGIELRNTQGQFVGSYEAVKRLSEGLAGLDPRDYRFSEIVEQLGGFRQIGKVIPMIRQFTTAQQALNVAQNASGSITRDAATAQQSLAVQAARVKEEFSALMRNFADSSTFRSVAKGALELARAFIKIADALGPMIPLLTTLMAMKIGASLGGGLGMLMGRGRRRSTGGKIHGFSGGGFVPGSGNSDSVPAMLQPGEFVIKKSSAKKLGSSSLHSMNGYKGGGAIIQPTNPEKYGVLSLIGKKSLATSGVKITRESALKELKKQILRKRGKPKGGAKQQHVSPTHGPVGGFKTSLSGSGKGAIGATAGQAKTAWGKMDSDQKAAKEKGYAKSLAKGKAAKSGDITSVNLKGPFQAVRISGKNNKGELGKDLSVAFAEASKAALDAGIKQISNAKLVKNLKIPPIEGDEQKLFNFDGLYKGAQETLEGYLLEGVVGALTNAKVGGGGTNFDFKEMTKATIKRLKKLFGYDEVVEKFIYADAKRSAAGADKGANSIQNKIASVLESGDYKEIGMAKGGVIDSVPAMLTPGEFVVKRSSAQSIGYSNLNKMNQTGAQHFARGGVVQGFDNGGEVEKLFKPGLVKGAATKIADKLKKIEANYTEMGLSTERMAKAMKVAEESLRTKGKSSSKSMKASFAAGLQETRQAHVEARGVKKQPIAGAAIKEGDTVGVPEQRMPGNLKLGTGPTGAHVRPVEKQPEKRPEAAGAAGAADIEAAKKELQSFTGQLKGLPTPEPELKAMQAGMDRYSQVIRQGGSKEKALGEARKATATSLRKSGGMTSAGIIQAEKLNQSRKTLAQKLSKAAQTAGKATGVGGRVKTGYGAAKTAGKAAFFPTAGGAEARGQVKAFAGGAAQKVGGTAEAMQKFVFLGAAVGAVTSQMSGLSESTKKAINETAGFAAGVVGITGTVISTMTSLISSNSLEAIASTQSALADDAEAASSTKAATAGGKVGGAMTGMLIGITVAIIALKYFSAKNKAVADESKKKWTEALNKIKTEAGGSADEIAANMGAEMEARTLAGKQFNTTSMATVGKMALLGASAGSLLGPLGAAVGGIIGAGAGFFMAMNRAQTETDLGAKARIAEVNAIRLTVAGLMELNNAQRVLSSTLSTIDSSGLSGERQVELRLEATKESLGVGSNIKGAQAESEISRVAAQIGASVAEVRGTGGDKGKLADLAKASGMDGAKADEIAVKASIALSVALMEQKSAQELAAANVQATAATYAKAADGIRAASDFTELRKALPAFAASLRQRQDALDQSGALEIQAAEAKLAAVNTSNTAGIAAARASLSDVKKRNATARTLLDESARKTVKAVAERIKADILAAKAAEAFRKELVKTNKFMRDLGGISDANAKKSKKLKDEEALIANKALDFSVAPTTGLGDLTMIRDLKKFDAEIRASIGNLPPAMRAQANKLLKSVTETAVLVTKGKESLVGKKIGLRATAPNAADILKSMGIDASKVDRDVMKQVSKDVALAFKDKIMSPKEFDTIFDPFIKEGEQKAKALAKIQNEVNKALANHAMSLNNQVAVLEKRTAAEERLASIQTKNEVMLAKAAGKDDIEIGKIREQGERKSAQRRLAGTGVRAGDLGGAVAARAAAEKRQEEIAKEKRDSTLSLGARKKLMTENRKMQIVIKRTTAEIQRLGNQSEKAGRLMDQIDAEKAKREVLTGLVTDFVVGGQEERRAMQKSVMGIQFAMATGTLQNQSPEQRQATVGMLDKLGDIEIPGAGGMTGKEVKKELVFRDAIKMGLDPKIARQIANATSKEEKLITALENLTKTMEKAAEAEVKATGGLVHMAGGGNTIFKPRGTDTVPAMLTPGEFVIKKSSVDKYGTGMMGAINSGRFAGGGRVAYRKKGGGDDADALRRYRESGWLTWLTQADPRDPQGKPWYLGGQFGFSDRKNKKGKHRSVQGIGGDRKQLKGMVDSYQPPKKITDLPRRSKARPFIDWDMLGKMFKGQMFMDTVDPINPAAHKEQQKWARERKARSKAGGGLISYFQGGNSVVELKRSERGVTVKERAHATKMAVALEKRRAKFEKAKAEWKWPRAPDEPIRRESMSEMFGGPKPREESMAEMFGEPRKEQEDIRPRKRRELEFNKAEGPKPREEGPQWRKRMKAARSLAGGGLVSYLDSGGNLPGTGGASRRMNERTSRTYGKKPRPFIDWKMLKEMFYPQGDFADVISPEQHKKQQDVIKARKSPSKYTKHFEKSGKLKPLQDSGGSERSRRALMLLLGAPMKSEKDILDAGRTWTDSKIPFWKKLMSQPGHMPRMASGGVVYRQLGGSGMGMTPFVSGSTRKGHAGGPFFAGAKYRQPFEMIMIDGKEVPVPKAEAAAVKKGLAKKAAAKKKEEKRQADIAGFRKRTAAIRKTPGFPHPKVRTTQPKKIRKTGKGLDTGANFDFSDFEDKFKGPVQMSVNRGGFGLSQDQIEFEKQKAQWQQITGGIGKLGGGIRAAIQKKKDKARSEKLDQQRDAFYGTLTLGTDEYKASPYPKMRIGDGLDITYATDSQEAAREARVDESRRVAARANRDALELPRPAPYQAGSDRVDAGAARANRIADDREKEVAAIQKEQQAPQVASGVGGLGNRPARDKLPAAVRNRRNDRRQQYFDARDKISTAARSARKRRLGKPQFTQQFDSRQEKVQWMKRMKAARGLAGGGQVDSVPAMLTPGEFVMSQNAVQRHGVGYMKSLNRGSVPGFNSGGIVNGANYLQKGSNSAVKGGGDGSILDKIAGFFTGVTNLNDSITKLQGVFSNLKMEHKFKGDMSLAFGITNVDALKKAVGEAITPYVEDLIVAELDNRFGSFNATGS